MERANKLAALPPAKLAVDDRSALKLLAGLHEALTLARSPCPRPQQLLDDPADAGYIRNCIKRRADALGNLPAR